MSSKNSLSKPPSLTRLPSQRISSRKDSNIYDEVINEQPDEENILQDYGQSNNFQYNSRLMIHQLKAGNNNDRISFSSLTPSQKTLEIQKIYQTKINTFILQVQSVIQQEKDEINSFVQNKPQRQHQLQLYIKKFQQLSNLLKSSIGCTNQFKIYITKKVLMILKSIGRLIQQDNYQSMLDKINQIAGINEKNQSQTKIGTEEETQPRQSSNSIKIKNEIFRKKKSLTLSLRLQNKPMPIQKENRTASFWHRMRKPLSQDDINFQQILQRVDQIHEKHLKTWQRHNTQMKELEIKKKQIRKKYASLKDKKSKKDSQSLETKVRQRKLFTFIKNHQENFDQEEERQLKQCFKTLDNEVSRRLSFSLPTLDRKQKRIIIPPKSQIQKTLKLDPIAKIKSSRVPLKLEKSSRPNYQIIPIQKIEKIEKKPYQSPPKDNRTVKVVDQLTVKNNERSLSTNKNVLRNSSKSPKSKIRIKNNSVQKSPNFRRLSPFPKIKQSSKSKRKSPNKRKLGELKNINKKQPKLKIN